MPKVVSKNEMPSRNRRKKYDMQAWIDGAQGVDEGDWLALVQGEDFDCTPSSLRNMLHGFLKQHGLVGSIATRATETELYIRAKSDGQPAASTKPEKSKKADSKKGSAKGKRKAS